MRLIVWCGDYRHQVEPDPGKLAERHGAETTVPDWRERLVCSQCGSRNVNMVVTGTKRRQPLTAIDRQRAAIDSPSKEILDQLSEFRGLLHLGHVTAMLDDGKP
jgi:hypothetical protein